MLIDTQGTVAQLLKKGFSSTYSFCFSRTVVSAKMRPSTNPDVDTEVARRNTLQRGEFPQSSLSSLIQADARLPKVHLFGRLLELLANHETLFESHK